MNKTISPILLLKLIVLFTAISCRVESDIKEPQLDQLPPITQTGAYTFGCLMDGEVWVPKHYSNRIVNPPVVLQAYLNEMNGNLFQVIADHDRKDDDSPLQILALFTYTDIINDTIILPPGDTGTRFIYERHPPKNGGSYKVYHSSGNKNSWVFLSRLDTINRIASGTFSVDLINIDHSLDTVKIRDGRFDMPF